MRRLAWSWSLLVLTLAPVASAQGPAAPSASASAAAPASAPASALAPAPALAPTPAPAPAPAPASSAAGLAVLALPGATDAAWPLARSVYATPSLRPAGVDEAHARVLCGEAAPPNAPADLRDLADTVAAVHGDDAPSRAILGNIAHRFAVKAVVLVRVDAGHASARAFLPDTGAFDAASYTPDEAPPANTGSAAPGAVAWSAATRSLARTYGVEPASAPAATAAAPTPASGAAAPTPTFVSAPALATHAEPHIDNGPPTSRPFWQSGWFWGAIGAAAFAGGALYFATRDNGPTTIHLQAQVPH